MKKYLVALSVLICILFLCFFVLPRFLSGNTLIYNTHNAKYRDHIDGHICQVIKDRGINKFIMCDQSKGYFFFTKEGFSSNADKKILSFVIEGRTRLVKHSNNSHVLFINDEDTLGIDYSLSKNNMALINGEISVAR